MIPISPDKRLFTLVQKAVVARELRVHRGITQPEQLYLCYDYVVVMLIINDVQNFANTIKVSQDHTLIV